MSDKTKVPTIEVEIFGLLWRAFGLRDSNDGLEMKAGLARRFKRCMQEAKIWVEQPNGDLFSKPDPRGGLQIPPTARPFVPIKEEASYLKECVKELKEKKNQDGSPFITAQVADHIEDIESIYLPRWTAPEVTPASIAAALPAPEVDAVPAPVEAHK